MNCCGCACPHGNGTLFDCVSSCPTDIVQTYLGGSADYNVVIPTNECITRCNTLPNKKIVIHSKLLTNLAIDKCTTLNIIRKELKVANSLTSGSVVMHIGNVKQQGSIENVSNRVNQLYNEGLISYSQRRLHLEISAGKGNDIGWRKEEIRHLWEGLDRNTVGICLDTQHAFASGLGKFETTTDVDSIFNILKNATGSYPNIIHLNDSRTQYQSRVDRHISIGNGYIWPEYSSEHYFTRSNMGLVRLKQYCDRYEIPVVSETDNPIQDAELWDNISYLVR
jgi:endonuclease IV